MNSKPSCCALVLYCIKEGTNPILHVMTLNCVCVHVCVVVFLSPQVSFPDCLLHPGEDYRHVTRYTFTTL